MSPHPLMATEEIFRTFIERFHVGNARSPLDGATLAQMEERLETLLPSAYVTFMQQHGGAYSPRIVDFIANEDSVEEQFDLQDLFDAKGVIETTEEGWTGELPRDLIAFGDDCMGNLFCFRRVERGEPRAGDAEVVLYENDFQDTRTVAESFTSFIASFLRFG